jgi:hypothetical protein
MLDAAQTHSLVQLNNQIQSSDEVLSMMVNMLTGYQTTLSKISEEIQILQDQSQTMTVKLNNRMVYILAYYL